MCCDIFDGQEITIKKYMEERFFFVLDVIIMNNNTIWKKKKLHREWLSSLFL